MASVEQKMERCRSALQEIMDGRELTAAEWERKAEIGRGTIRKFIRNPDRDISLRTLLKLAEVYRLTIAEMAGEV